MQSGQLIAVRTNPATQFRAALAQNAALTLDLAPVGAGQTPGDGYVDEGLAAGRSVRARLRAIGLWSVENLDWEIWLWAKDTYNTPTLISGLLAPLGRWSFIAADAVRIAGAGAYFYYIDGLDVGYFDADNTGELHLMLVNRSAAAKTVNDAGAVQVQMQFENTLGW